MADRVSAAIRIGGVLSPACLADLVAAITADDARTDWEGEAFTADAIEPDTHLYLMAHEVAWGAFNAIETFCQQQGLVYARWSGGAPGSFGPERVVFDGSGSVQHFAASDDDEVMISAELVRSLGSLAAITAYFDRAERVIPPLTLNAV